MTPEQAKRYKFNPFDVTQVWYHSDFPLIRLGKMVLNRNPENYFAEVEQIGFSPSNFVPGIGPSPDKLLQGRLFSYADAQRYRIGTNFQQLPVNAPHCPVHDYQRDGHSQLKSEGAPNYWPNSAGGPSPEPSFAPPEIDLHAVIARHDIDTEELDFVQPGELYRRVLDDGAKHNLISNIVGHLGNAKQNIQYRQTALFYKADAEYGTRVAEGLKLDVERVKHLASLSQKERAEATR